MSTPATADQWTYKGWQIGFDLKPIPVRSFDWTATSPDYDVDCDQDGFFCCSGQQVHAATYEDLLFEIDCAIMDAEDEE
jgi:hypothetical protein